MKFTLRQIEIYLEAAKDENFRKTADRLGISQPSISKHINLLEANAGARLFDRGRGSSARLSPRGKELLAEAKALMQRATKVDGSALGGETTKPLRIVAGEYLLDRHLRQIVRRMYALGNMPDLELASASNVEDLFAKVRSGEADCGFFTGSSRAEPDLRITVLNVVSVGLYASTDLARTLSASVEGMADAPFVLSSRGSTAETWQKAILGRAGISPARVSARAQYMEVMIDLVLNGSGIGLLFDEDAAPLVAEGRLVRFPFEIESGSRCLVTAAPFRPSAAAGKAIDFICSAMR